MKHLRLIATDAKHTPTALAHRSKRGVDWFLHEGKTKTGKPKYFVAKQSGVGVLHEMPAGFEFSESINGVVSVRRVSASNLSREVAVVRTELSQHRHLRRHQVDAQKGNVIVFEPLGEDPVELARLLGRSLEFVEERLGPAKRFQPVMRFEGTDEAGIFAVKRMTYRGAAGWSYELSRGPLAALCRKYLPVIGTEAFFELM